MVKAEVLSASGRRRTKSVLAREEGRDDVFIWVSGCVSCSALNDQNFHFRRELSRSTIASC